MTDNSIAFPLSSVASNSSLEKISSTKDSGNANSFQTVLDSYVTQSNTDDKAVKNDTSQTQNKLADDSSEVTEHTVQQSNENQAPVELEKDAGNQSPEAVHAISETSEKLQIPTLTEELQTSDIESINLQDQSNLPTPSLINIIAAQTFNNKLAQQQKTMVSATETAPTSAILAGPSPETLNKLNPPTQTHGEDFAAQLSPNIAAENKANTTEAIKFVNTHLETQLADQPKLVNTINALDIPLPIVGQSQTSPQIASTNSINQSLPSYAVPNNFYSDNWNSSVHQQVLLLRHNNIDNATLILNPEHLGPIHVSIQIDAQSQTSVQFWSQNPDVRQALRDGLPNLNTLFQDSGLQLGSADVSSQQNASSDNNNPKQNQANKQLGLSSDELNQENQVATPLAVTNLVNVYI